MTLTLSIANPATSVTIRFQFVVPSKFVAYLVLQPQRHLPRRYLDEPRLHARRPCLRRNWPLNLSLRRQPVQHVRQRLRVHQPVLDRHFQHSYQLRMSFLRTRERMLNRMIQFTPQAPVVNLHLIPLGPIAWPVVGQSPSNRVNPKRKKIIKRPLPRAQSKRALRKQVPIERLDVSQIKDDSVSFWNGPVVNGFFSHNPKQGIGLRSCFCKAGVKVVPDADSGGGGSHGVFPLNWMLLPREGCAGFRRRGAE